MGLFDQGKYEKVNVPPIGLPIVKECERCGKTLNWYWDETRKYIECSWCKNGIRADYKNWLESGMKENSK